MTKRASDAVLKQRDYHKEPWKPTLATETIASGLGFTD